MSETFVLIEGKAENFNAESGCYTVGLPAMTAFAGFVHNFERQINTHLSKLNVENKVSVESFALLTKQIELYQGHCAYITGMKGVDDFKQIAPQTVDEKRAKGYFAFILKLNCTLSTDDLANINDTYFLKDSNFTGDMVGLYKSILFSSKLAGGSFHISKIHEKSNLIDIMNILKRKAYFYVVDESDCLHQNSSDSEIEALITKDEYDIMSKEKLRHFSKTNYDVISFMNKISRPNKGYQKEKTADTENNENSVNIAETYKESKDVDLYKPHYIPIVSGYHLLEEPTYKSNSRCIEQKHAICEPILSIARYQSSLSVSYQYVKESILPNIFWQYKIDENNKLYYISAI